MCPPGKVQRLVLQLRLTRLNLLALRPVARLAEELQVRHRGCPTLGHGDDMVELQVLLRAALHAATAVSSPHFASDSLGDWGPGGLLIRQRSGWRVEGHLNYNPARLTVTLVLADLDVVPPTKPYSSFHRSMTCGARGVPAAACIFFLQCRHW